MPFPRPIRSQTQELSVVKSWLMGFLAGDGSVYDTFGAGYNTNEQLARRVADAIREVYDYEPRVRLIAREAPRQDIWHVTFGLNISLDLQGFSTWGRLAWRVPKLVERGSDEIKCAWLRGFFDAEGCVHVYELKRRGRGLDKIHVIPDRNTWRVSVTSVNEAAINDVLRLLGSLKIKSKLYRTVRKNQPNRRPYYTIWIHERESVVRFASLVSFEATVKKNLLAGVFTAPFGKESVWEKTLPKIDELIAAGKSHRDVERELDLYDGEVGTAIQWRRRRLGLPKTRRDSLGPVAEKVVALRGEGLSNREVSERLSLPLHTIKAAWLWHRERSGLAKRESGATYAKRLAKIHEIGLDDATAEVTAEKLGVAVHLVEHARAWYRKKVLDLEPKIRIQDHAEEIIARRLRGETLGVIAQAVGCSIAAVSIFCTKHEVKPAPSMSTSADQERKK